MIKIDRINLARDIFQEIVFINLISMFVLLIDRVYLYYDYQEMLVQFATHVFVLVVNKLFFDLLLNNILNKKSINTIGAAFWTF